MPKQPAFEEVFQEFQKKGYELLEIEYKNNTTPMRYRCPSHPDKETKITFKNLKKGSRCSYCAGVAKPTFSEVKEVFESRGYVLLEIKYKNIKTKMKYQCPTHPDKELSIRYEQLKRGEGCPYCAGNIKLNYGFVNEEFDKRGYELLEVNYTDSHTKMKYRCPNHPDKDLFISYGDLKQGYGCRCCYEDNRRESFNCVRREFENRGYILLSDNKDYKNHNSELEYRCPLHPDRELKIKYGRLKCGGGCPYCGGYAKPTIDELKIMFGQRGYILLEDKYIGINTKMKFKCLKHINANNLEITYNSFSRGHGCKYCGKEKSISRRKGENHSSWKGGVTEITAFLRRKLKDWKWDSLKEYNYKCAITKEWHSDLHIHHHKPFYKVRDEIFEELSMPIYKTIGEYSQEQLDNLVLKLKEKHNEFIGIPMRKHLHELFHQLYNYDTTYEDFCQFKDRYISGEFKDISL